MLVSLFYVSWYTFFMAGNTYQTIYAVCKQIPKGKVATYGQIAALIGSPRGARMVGWALHVLPPDMEKKVPWQRIINREGRISTTCREHTPNHQATLLRKEGVKVIKREDAWFIDLDKYLWHP